MNDIESVKCFEALALDPRYNIYMLALLVVVPRNINAPKKTPAVGN